MTIKDIELRSGMTRANIRYYESLGLLSPARGENGYRDYSEADIAALLKIKLLRSLEVSLEDIGALSRGESALGEVLSRQMEALEAKEQELHQARELCRQMQSDRAEFQSLDAAHYLTLMLEQSEALARAREIDRVEKVDRPFRRWFARGLDEAIYSTFIDIFLIICGLNSLGFAALQRTFVLLGGVVLMLIVEPVLLSTWGTTPGKWVMGLCVRCYDGTKPSLNAAFYRVWDILRWGYGFFIPFYSLYRLYKSLFACLEPEELPWESDCLVRMKSPSKLRWAALVGAHVLLTLALAAAVYLAFMPMHHSPLSTEAFVRDYNRLSRFMGYQNVFELSIDGVFEQSGRSSETGTATVYIYGPPSGYPSFSFIESGGVLEGFTMTKKVISSHINPVAYSDYISVAAQSFIHGKTGGIFSEDLRPLVDWLTEHPFEDFTMSLRGYDIKIDYEYRGYLPTEEYGILMADDSTGDQYFELQFSLSPSA